MPRNELIKPLVREGLGHMDIRWLAHVREMQEKGALDAIDAEALFRNSHWLMIEEPARTQVIKKLLETYGLKESGPSFRGQLNIGKCIKLQDEGVRIDDIQKVTGYYNSGVLEEKLRPFKTEQPNPPYAPRPISFINYVDSVRASIAISALTGIPSITTRQEDRPRLVALLLSLKFIRPEAREEVADIIRDTPAARALAGYYTISDEALDVLRYRGLFSVVEERMHVDSILKPRLLHHG